MTHSHSEGNVALSEVKIIKNRQIAVMELTTLSFNILGGTDSRLEKTSKQMTR
jgi:hypothetical protein